jgi:hypothetical protein
MANEIVNQIFDQYDFCSETTIYITEYTEIGHNSDIPSSAKSGFRFTSVLIPQGTTISYAELRIKAQFKVGTGRLKAIAYGIDEDNTADFSSNPFGRTKTTANSTRDVSPPEIGTYFEFDVTSLVQEIVNRAGWASGNNLGILVEDNGSDTGNRIATGSTQGYDTYLYYRLAAEPNFFPTPGTVSAPTFPVATDYGIKVSKPGIDVGTVTETNLSFTTREKVLKVISEGTSGFTGGTATFSHSLGYQPASISYLKGTAGEKMFKLNKGVEPNLASPLPDDDVTGYTVSGTSSVKVLSQSGSLCYTYIFIDPL